MIPSYFVQIEQIPLTLNHKVDRKSLPDPKFLEEAETENIVKPNTKIEKDLCNIFKEALEISQIGIENDIFDYNIDSLDIIRIQTKMLDFNYKLNTQDFYKCRTIKDLAKTIENNNTQEISKEEAIYLSNVNNSFNKYSQDYQIKKNDYKEILLLGSTGYLGMHILRDILTQTQAKVTCLIRKKNYKDVTNRLLEMYKLYFNENIPVDRVCVIDADITKPHLGLEPNIYINLQTKIDLAINTAANVRYYGEYKKFRDTNVGVVQNLIEFCIKKNIQLIHISTLGVSGNYLVNHEKNDNDFSENDFYIGQQYNENVYIQTKFEAEKLIYEKVRDGLNASIFRIGNLTSRYADGGFQQNFEENAFYNILIMILKYHILPNTMVNEFLEFTPVDYCARAICKLIFNIDTNKNVYHIFNQNYIKVSDLLNMFEKNGFNTKIISGNEFKERILMLSNQYPEENILKGIVNDLDDEMGLSFKATVNQKNENTNACLAKLGFEWVNIENEYIEKIIKYLKDKNFIN